MSPILQVLQSLAHLSPPLLFGFGTNSGYETVWQQVAGGGVWYGVVGGGHGVIETGTMSDPLPYE